MKKNGFTLIELMVVVGIVILISSLVVVNVNQARKKARDARRIADLATVSSALQTYYADFHSYPDSAVTHGLRLLTPTYLINQPKDPKTNNYYSYTACQSGGSPCNNSTTFCSSYIATTTLEDQNHNPIDRTTTTYSVKKGEGTTSTTCD